MDEQEKYRDWPIVDSIPDGWKIDNTAGSPLGGCVFITNGVSVLTGNQKRALLRVRVPEYADDFERKTSKKKR